METRLCLSPQCQIDIRVHGGVAPIALEEVIFKVATNISIGGRGATSSSTLTNHHSTPTQEPTRRSINLVARFVGISTTSTMFAITSRGGATHAMRRRSFINKNMTPNGETPTLLFGRLLMPTPAMPLCLLPILKAEVISTFVRGLYRHDELYRKVNRKPPKMIDEMF